MTKKIIQQIIDEFRCFWRNTPAAIFTFALVIAFLLLELILLKGNHIKIDDKELLAPNYLVPSIGSFGIVGATFTTLVMTISSRRFIGVLKKLVRSPIPAWVYLSGLIGAALINAILIILLSSAIGVLFGFNLSNINYFLFIGWFFFGCVTLSSLGLAVSTFFSDPQQAAGIVNLILIPVAVLSGVFSPLPNNHLLNLITEALPLKPFIQTMIFSFNGHLLTHQLTSTQDLKYVAILAIWLILSIAVFIKRFRSLV